MAFNILPLLLLLPMVVLDGPSGRSIAGRRQGSICPRCFLLRCNDGIYADAVCPKQTLQGVGGGTGERGQRRFVDGENGADQVDRRTVLYFFLERPRRLVVSVFFPPPSHGNAWPPRVLFSLPLLRARFVCHRPPCWVFLLGPRLSSSTPAPGPSVSTGPD